MLPLSTILGKLNPLDKNNPSLSSEFYLGLVITDKKVKSAVWNISEKGIDHLTLGSAEGWGGTGAEELIVAADASIANAVTKIVVVGKQPDKIILGLPEHWVSGNNIVEDKMNLLQAVCRKLQLKPLGFVVIPEAIAHYLKLEEGGLPSTILVNLSEAEIVVSLICQGKFQGSKLVGRSDNLALDLEEGLLRFNYQGVLPNRILLLGRSDLEDIEESKRSLVAYPWIGPEKKLNFLQLPRVDVAEEDFDVNATVIAGCRELGLGVKEKPASSGRNVPQFTQEIVEEESPKSTPEPEVTKEIVEKEPVEQKAESYSEEDFGFVKGKDIQASPALADLPPTPLSSSPDFEPPLPSKRSTRRFNFKVFPLAFSPKKLVAFFRGFRFSLRLPNPALPSIKSRGLLFVALAVFLVLGGFLFSFYKFSRAEIILFVQPQKIDREFEFTTSSKIAAVDSQQMIVPRRKSTVTVSGEKSSSVSGKKTVGDKASGEVVVYNRTDEAKKIPQGAVLKGPGSLKFVLDTEVNVASKTADLVNGVDKWGEARVKVVAGEIGAQYNLAADSVLSFESYSSTSFLVKNPTAFSGGTSREIQAVSKQDRTLLQQALLAELKQKAESQASAELSGHDQLLPNSLALEDKTDRFNHDLGDEADSLTLETKATYSISFIQEADFKALTEKVVSGLVPENYQAQAVSEENNFTLKDEKKGIYAAHIKREFLPQINLEELPGRLKAKTTAKAQSLLSAENQVAGVEIMLTPKLFSYLKFLPLVKENIYVSVESI